MGNVSFVPEFRPRISKYASCRCKKVKREFSLRRPIRSQEANVREKASACSVRNDGGVVEATGEGMWEEKRRPASFEMPGGGGGRVGGGGGGKKGASLRIQSRG